MTLPPKRSKANLNSACIWGYQSKTGAASRGGKLISTPTALSLFEPCFLPLSFLIFPPSLVQFSRHHNQGKDAWIQMSSGRSLGIKHTSTFWSLLGFNSQIDGFALLIFGSWSVPPDANRGALKSADEGVMTATFQVDESQLWRQTLHLNSDSCYFVTWPSSLEWN